MRQCARGFCGLSSKLLQAAFIVWASKPWTGLPIWASKPGVGGKSGVSGRVGSEDMWNHRKACVEAKRSFEGDMFIQCSEQKLDDFTPKGYLGCVFHVRAFWSFVGRLYI